MSQSFAQSNEKYLRYAKSCIVRSTDPYRTSTLSQDGHPVAFLSHRLTEAEERWDTGDQELLAFMIALREWRVYLYGRPFTFVTDHEPLRYLQTKARLSGRQKRWLDILQEHDYDTLHVAGDKNTVPDALSRRPDHEPRLGVMTVREGSDYSTQIIAGYDQDTWAKQLISVFSEGSSPTDGKVKRALSNYDYDGTHLRWTGTNPTSLYIPGCESLRRDLMSDSHTTGHFGVEKTYNSLARIAYWPNMHDDVYEFVTRCHTCQINKVPTQRPAGRLQPHAIPEQPWEVITADFLTELPTTRQGNDTVLIVVDKLSKRCVLIPTRKDISARDVAQLFQDHVFTKYGTPTTIITDRDPKFTARFWRCLTELKNVRLNLSTADHPQTDGQSEVMVKTLSNMIRSSIQKDKHDWDTVLSQLEFEYNASTHASTKMTPFQVDIGRIPANSRFRRLTECVFQNQAAADFTERLSMFRRIARDNLALAQARQKQYADRRRRPLNFKKDDLVLLDARSLDISNRSDLPRKWRPRYLGPLRVIEATGPVTYRVELPPTMRRAHNVFHVSKLKGYKKPAGDGPLLPIVIDADGTEEFEVKAILDKKKEKRSVSYLVQFEGEPVEEAIWLPKAELTNCRDLIREFDNSLRAANSRTG